MTQLYEKSLIKLELDQVLELLASCAGSQEGKKACLSLLPTSDLEDVRAMQAETTAACNLCDKKGYPGFSGVQDVSDSVDRANLGGTLQPKELLTVASLLRCARTVNGYIGDDEEATVHTGHGTERKSFSCNVWDDERINKIIAHLNFGTEVEQVKKVA